MYNILVQALGNHEFDGHVDGLVPFLQNVSSPVVAANIRMENEAALKGDYKVLQKSLCTLAQLSDVNVPGSKELLLFCYECCSQLLLSVRSDLVAPSVVVEVGGRKIGIIGYVTTDTAVFKSALLSFQDSEIRLSFCFAGHI